MDRVPSIKTVDMPAPTASFGERHIDGVHHHIKHCGEQRVDAGQHHHGEQVAQRGDSHKEP